MTIGPGPPYLRLGLLTIVADSDLFVRIDYTTLLKLYRAIQKRFRPLSCSNDPSLRQWS